MRVKRFIALLAIAGTLTVLVVAILAASGERTQQAQAQGTETLELVNVDTVRQGLFPDTWQITPPINPGNRSGVGLVTEGPAVPGSVGGGGRR